MNTLICIGELLIDFIPVEKGLKLKDVSRYERNAGGAPANVAACVSRLGGNSTMLTQVGQDGFGAYLIQTLKSVGVNISHIKQTDKANTALAFVSLTKEGERDFTFYRNPSADMLLSPKDIDEDLFVSGNILHFCSVDLVDYPVKKAHKKAIDYAHKHGMIISFDPNLRFPLWPDKEQYKKTINEFLTKAHILKISDDELSFITGFDTLKEGIASLFKGNVQIVILTEGKNGATVYSKNNSIFVPSIQTTAIDTTGAGDAFIGGLLYQALKRHLTVDRLDELLNDEIIRFAHAVSSHVVSRKGAIPAMPSLQDIEKALI